MLSQLAKEHQHQQQGRKLELGTNHNLKRANKDNLTYHLLKKKSVHKL